MIALGKREKSRSDKPPKEPKGLRIAYVSGPVDALDVYEKRASNREPGYFGTNYMGQFFDVCDARSAEVYIITTESGSHTRAQMPGMIVENRPLRWDLSGLRWHLANIAWLLRLLPSLVSFRPDILVVTAQQNYWFLLGLLPRRIAIVPILTCMLWGKFARPKPASRVLLRLNRLFFWTRPVAIIAASTDIVQQVRAQLRGRTTPISVFLATYDRDQFESIPPPSFESRPFRIYFAGRVTRYKGVYDLVTIARWLEEREPGRFHIDICGDGPELKSLRNEIQNAKLENVVTCHGYCERTDLARILGQSNIVIVPTTTDFEEGFNMVCSEAILAGRPLITSAVCPAINYVRQATVEVTPDNVKEYFEAIIALANRRDLFEEKRIACRAEQEKFYDKRQSWGAKLDEAIEEALFPPVPQARELERT